MRSEEGYDERALARILKRGAELEAGRGPTAERSGRYAMEEIEAIAREAGISPENVRRAAAELETGKAAAKSRFLGAPTRLEAFRSLPREAPEEALEDALDALPGLAGLRGNGSVRRGNLRWAVDGYEVSRTGKDLSVEVRSKEGRTEIRVRSNLAGLAGAFFGGIMGGLGLGAGVGIGTGVGIGALGSPSFALAFGLGAFGLSYLLARSLYVASAKSLARDLESLAGKLQEGLLRE